MQDSGLPVAGLVLVSDRDGQGVFSRGKIGETGSSNPDACRFWGRWNFPGEKCRCLSTADSKPEIQLEPEPQAGQMPFIQQQQFLRI